jgi:hypothetical protein
MLFSLEKSLPDFSDVAIHQTLLRVNNYPDAFFLENLLTDPNLLLICRDPFESNKITEVSVRVLAAFNSAVARICFALLILSTFCQEILGWIVTVI